RNRTKGGTNTVQLSVLRGNTLEGAKEITATIDDREVSERLNDRYQGLVWKKKRTSLRDLLATGFEIPHDVPPELTLAANAIKIKPWTEGEEMRGLDANAADAIAKRISGQGNSLVEKAEQLHRKAMITDAGLQATKDYNSRWQEIAQYFAESSAMLKKHKV